MCYVVNNIFNIKTTDLFKFCFIKNKHEFFGVVFGFRKIIGDDSVEFGILSSVVEY